MASFWGGYRSYLDDPSPASLRQLISDYLHSCVYLPPCWYRVNSRENNMLPDGETKALLQSLDKVFGLPDSMSNCLLVASGLMNLDGWNDLKENRDLDIDVELASHAALLGEKVLVIRIGSFKDEDPFDAVALVKKIDENNYTISHKRSIEQRSFIAAVVRNLPLRLPVDDDDDDDDDDNDDNDDNDDDDNDESEAEDAIAPATVATAAALAAAPTTTDSPAFDDPDPDPEEEAAFRIMLSTARKFPKAYERFLLDYVPSAPKTMDGNEKTVRKRKSGEASL
jgi:hypothetical protein